MQGLPPRGRYLAHEVGRLAGVSGDRIGQWARRGYIRSSQSTDTPQVYSYQDVAEAMVVHELLERGASLPAIKNAIETLRKEYGDWPLTHANLLAAGKSIVVSEGGEHVDVGRHPDHGYAVIGTEDLRRISADLRRGGWAARELNDLEHVEVDPARLSGRPTIRGRRVPVEKVAELAQTEEGWQTLREDYDLSDAEIHDAQRWWNRVRGYEAA